MLEFYKAVFFHLKKKWFNAVCSQIFIFTGNQMALGGAALGVTNSDQTNLHADSVPNALNTNKSVLAKNYISIHITFSFYCFKNFFLLTETWIVNVE